MADWEKPSGSRKSGHPQHTQQDTGNKRAPGRPHHRNDKRVPSGEDATLYDLRRDRVSSRNSQHSSGDIRPAKSAPASPRHDNDAWGTRRDGSYDGQDGHGSYIREPRDDRDEPSWNAQNSHARREHGHDAVRGSGSSAGRTRERSKPLSQPLSSYQDGIGPTDWDDIGWRDPSGGAEDEMSGWHAGDGVHGNHTQASSRYREYGQHDATGDRSRHRAAGGSRSRSTRSHAGDETDFSPYERDHESRSSRRDQWREFTGSLRVDRWREFTGSLFALSDDTTGEQSSLMKRLTSTRRRVVLVSMAAIILLCTIITVPVSAVSAMQSMSLARDGLNHLKSAENSLKLVEKNPFDSASIKSARADFVAAHDDFVQVNGRLGLIPGPVDIVPVAGSKLSGARHLVPIAIEGTQAAIIACDALTLVVSSLKDPLNPKAGGLSAQNYALVQADWGQIQQLFSTMVDQITALQPSDLTLDPRLGPAIQSFRTNMPKIQQAVQSVGVLVQLLPQLIGIGKPSNFLVEVLDSTELRPAGGFIGNYGFLTLDGGRLTGLHIQDVDLLDVAVKHGNHAIAVPTQYSWFDSIFGSYEPRWGFRDSNLDADFPTAAQNGEKLYLAEAGDLQTETQYFKRTPVPLQGVVSLTPWLIQNALRITGPVHIGDIYNETVTADNIIQRIHYYALKNTYGGGCDTCVNTASGTSDRKRFTGFLFQAFMDKVKESLKVPGKIGQFAKLFTDSLHTKDIEIYLNDPKAEEVLHLYGLASMIEAPPTGDSVFKVDANIGGNKSNYVLKYDMSDSITIDASGTATHHLTFKYIWPNDPNTLNETYPADGAPAGVHHSYTRVYVPPSAVIQPSGWPRQSISKAFGREVYGGDVYGRFAQTLTYTLTWKVPGAATHDATGWHYHLLFQKQAGVIVPLTLQIALPSCATLGTHTDLLKAAGATNLTFKDPLMNDLNLSIDYAC